MSVFTLFASPIMSAWKSDVGYDPHANNVPDIVNDMVRIGILHTLKEDIELDLSEVHIFEPANLALVEWVWLVIKVEGSARVDLVGKDVDDTTTLSSFFQAEGTAEYPGFVVVSSYNLSSIDIVGRVAGTKVTAFGAIAAADGDVRLTTNA